MRVRAGRGEVSSEEDDQKRQQRLKSPPRGHASEAEIIRFFEAAAEQYGLAEDDGEESGTGDSDDNMLQDLLGDVGDDSSEEPDLRRKAKATPIPATGPEWSDLSEEDEGGDVTPATAPLSEVVKPRMRAESDSSDEPSLLTTARAKSNLDKDLARLVHDSDEDMADAVAASEDRAAPSLARAQASQARRNGKGKSRQDGDEDFRPASGPKTKFGKEGRGRRRNSTRSVPCPECGLLFLSLQGMLSHRRGMHGYKEDARAVRARQEALAQAEERREAMVAAHGGVPCPDCGGIFANVQAMLSHRRYKHGNYDK